MGLFGPVLLGWGIYRLAKAAVDDVRKDSQWRAQNEAELQLAKEEERQRIMKELVTLACVVRMDRMEVDSVRERRIALEKRLGELCATETGGQVEEEWRPSQRPRRDRESRELQREYDLQRRMSYDWDQEPIVPSYSPPSSE